MQCLPTILFVSILAVPGCYGSSDFNQGIPFTKQQIMDLRNGLEKGITYQQVREILGRDADTVWRYKSNSGTIPITVREFHDKYGHSVVVHLNSGNQVVAGSHDVSTFSP